MKLLKSALVFSMVAQLFVANIAFADEASTERNSRELSDGNVYDSNGDNWGVAWGWGFSSLAALIVSGVAEAVGTKFESGTAGRHTQYWLGANAVAGLIIAASGTWK